MKKINTHAIVLSLSFFVIAFFLTPLIFREITSHFIHYLHYPGIVSPALNEHSLIPFMTILSFGLIPVIAMLLFYIIQVIKKKTAPLSEFYKVVFIMTLFYVLGAIVKLKLLESAVKDSNAVVDSSLLESLPMGQFDFYIWGFLSALLVTFVVALGKLSGNS